MTYLLCWIIWNWFEIIVGIYYYQLFTLLILIYWIDYFTRFYAFTCLSVCLTRVYSFLVINWKNAKILKDLITKGDKNDGKRKKRKSKSRKRFEIIEKERKTKENSEITKNSQEWEFEVFEVRREELKWETTSENRKWNMGNKESQWKQEREENSKTKGSKWIEIIKSHREASKVVSEASKVAK